MGPDTASTAQLLRRAGLRVTASRYTVLEWLSQHPHATAEEIRVGVQQRLGTISKQAVYDVLAACVTAGLARQIEPAGHPARFERRAGDNHHHLVCRSCGAIRDADCRVAGRPCLHPEDDRGYRIDEAEIVFWGTCPACRSELGATSEHTSAAGDHALDDHHIHVPTEV